MTSKKYPAPSLPASHAEESQNLIECNNVSFRYGQELVLEDVSFKVKNGQYVALIGPNGGGKTTLIKILLGIFHPQKGSMHIAKNTSIGYIPQRLNDMVATFPATVKEIIESGLPWKNKLSPTKKLSPTTETPGAMSIEKAIALADIDHLQKRLIGDLSGGELQKVFIARALVSNPKLLILDEPTVGIDPVFTQTFYTLLKKLNKEIGIAIILVSHDLETVRMEVEELLCINKKLVCSGHKLTIMNNTLLSELYGSSVKFIHHTHE